MYFRAGSLKDACSVLDDIDKRPNIVPDMFLLRDMLQIYQRCNMALPVDEFSRLFDEMLQRGFLPNTITYNVMLNVIGEAKLFKKVRRH
ncbi:pentatricopeptide repeat-containing protein chloroplastic-like, partial [Trifolium pratense]